LKEQIKKYEETKNIELTVKNQYLEEQTRKLQDTISGLASQGMNKPTTTTNKQIIKQKIVTPLNMNKESFEKKINEFLQLRDVQNGVKGLAKFTVEKLLTDEQGLLMYRCSDLSNFDSLLLTLYF
jgi:hypothetical protein